MWIVLLFLKAMLVVIGVVFIAWVTVLVIGLIVVVCTHIRELKHEE